MESPGQFSVEINSLQVAVLRGYHAKDPSGEPMCRDTDAVDIAIRAGVDVA
jgi:hypothetical protein